MSEISDILKIQETPLARGLCISYNVPMKLACIHTHSTFCDGIDDIETCCRIAYEKGLSAIGFSGHSPVTKKTGIIASWNRMNEDGMFSRYIDEVGAAKKRWEGRLPVYLGLEVEFVSGLTGPADREYHEIGLDYIIGAVHYVVPPRGEIFAVDGSPENLDQGIREGFGGDAMAMVEAYYDAMAEMIRAGGFDFLAHPDLLKKNNYASRIFSEDHKIYREKAAALAALTAAAGIAAEINTGGLNRGKTIDCYPSPWLLKLFFEQGVPMLINADAHQADHLDGHYGEARQALLEAGYTETLLFQGKKDGKGQWKNIPLL